MRTCEMCGRRLKAHQERFCTQLCRNRAGGISARGGNRKPPTTKTCEACGQSFVTKPSRATTARFCSRACLLKVGRRSPPVRFLAEKPCEVCGNVFSFPRTTANERRTCSNACRAVLYSREADRHTRRGEASNLWKHGESGAYYRRLMREEVAKGCSLCGSHKHVLVHHIDENQRNNDPSNLKALCKLCHQRHHRGIIDANNPTSQSTTT